MMRAVGSSIHHLLTLAVIPDCVSYTGIGAPLVGRSGCNMVEHMVVGGIMHGGALEDAVDISNVHEGRLYRLPRPHVITHTWQSRCMFARLMAISSYPGRIYSCD